MCVCVDIHRGLHPRWEEIVLTLHTATRPVSNGLEVGTSPVAQGVWEYAWECSKTLQISRVLELKNVVLGDGEIVQSVKYLVCKYEVWIVGSLGGRGQSIITNSRPAPAE